MPIFRNFVNGRYDAHTSEERKNVKALLLHFIREHSSQPDEGALERQQQQSFPDQYGNFMTQVETYLLTRSNKQMVVGAGNRPRRRLYSEHPY